MTNSSGPSSASPNHKFAEVIAPDGTPLGDVTLFTDGRATVMNGWSGLQQWFDDPSTGHKDALWYVYTRMCDMPTFSAKIFKDTDLAEIKKKLVDAYALA